MEDRETALQKRRDFYDANRERIAQDKADRYAANINGYADREEARVRAKAITHAALIAPFKSVPCADCGISYPPFVMDFDHVRGEKLFNIGPSAMRTTDAIIAEIEKCEVVCSNCHRFRTAARKAVLN